MEKSGKGIHFSTAGMAQPARPENFFALTKHHTPSVTNEKLEAKPPLPRGGLYAITPDAWPENRLLAAVKAALEGGAGMVQYRAKNASRPSRRRQATRLQALLAAYSAPLIINDDPYLAAEIGAAGVHLGADDPEPAAARQLLGPRAIIGWSCYNDRSRLLEAQSAGVDYVALGAFYPSSTKPETRRATPGDLAAARLTGLPIVAIGGITVQNCASLLAAGADWLAVCAGLFGKVDDAPAAIQRRAAAFAACLANFNQECP